MENKMENNLVVVENGLAQDGGYISNKGDINSTIKNGVNLIKRELNTNEELRKKVILKVVEKKIVDDVEHDFDISDINVLNELNDFVNLQNSDITKKNYLIWIKSFIEWCNNEKINCIEINRREVESYLLYICGKYSSNSVRSKITSVSAFYTFLIHRYPKIITRISPFYKLKLPKIRLVRRIDIITSNDIKELKKEFKRIGRDDLICAVDLMVKYGFRVGIFEKMKIDKNGNWKSISKEHEMKGKFTKKEASIIKESGLLKLKAYNITNNFKKYNKKLFNEGKIGSEFSPHDLRHYYITKNGKDLCIEDFIKFSRGIHKNVNTTLGYMNI
jgi:site-specific recombinase XerD